MNFNFEIEIELLRSLYEYLQLNLDIDYENGELEEYMVFTWFTREMSYRKSMQDALELTSQYLGFASIFIFTVARILELS